jgi:ketosteroid isomerase-like protein
MRPPPRRLVAIGFMLAMLAPLAFAGGQAPAAAKARGAAGPTAESALAADEELARAIRDNDAEGISRMLTDDWAVVAGSGGVGEGKSIFPDGIRSGALTRKTFAISEPRVRIYGNVAVVTTKVQTSGTFNGKPFDVIERQTDVLLWKQGGWKAVLTHETVMQHV